MPLQRSRGTPRCWLRRDRKSEGTSRWDALVSLGWPVPPPATRRRRPPGQCPARLQSSRHVTDPQQQAALLQEGEETADFIATQIVQAAVNERGNYGACSTSAALCALLPTPAIIAQPLRCLAEMAISHEHLGGLVEPVQDAKLPRQKKQKPE